MLFQKRQRVICDKLALLESCNDPDLEFDIWAFINNILDGEESSGSTEWDFCSEILTGKYFSGNARTKRGVELILFYMRNAEAWRHDNIYRSIKKISKQNVKHMSLQKALKYAVCRKQFHILEVLRTSAERDYDHTDNSRSESNNSERDNDDVFESEID